MFFKEYEQHIFSYAQEKNGTVQVSTYNKDTDAGKDVLVYLRAATGKDVLVYLRAATAVVAGTE